MWCSHRDETCSFTQDQLLREFMVYGSLGHHVLHRAHGEFGLAGGAEEVQALSRTC